ncbi:MAG TPA: hypothetical protein VKV36_04500 [Acidimicrobiales bacterium]|nr:hypothetical protein [Acidimicrobiales bacterium]
MARERVRGVVRAQQAGASLDAPAMLAGSPPMPSLSDSPPPAPPPAAGADTRLGDWQPSAEERSDVVTPAAAAALHGLLDASGPPPLAGSPLPPLWHWLAFLPVAAQRDLGPDGHPRPGTFLPPLAPARRMFAGVRCELIEPVPVGAALHRRSIVTSVTHKAGRSGPLTFVEVTHRYALEAGAEPAIVEVQDLVFRLPLTEPPHRLVGSAPPEGAGTGRPAGEDAPEPPGPPWAWRHELPTDPVLLFRFSALTYNAHRIHYDRDYARGVEGYPDLVVHGPLQAVALAELCRRHVPARLTWLHARARRPAFSGPPLTLLGRWSDGGAGVELAAVGADGQVTMTARAGVAAG